MPSEDAVAQVQVELGVFSTTFRLTAHESLVINLVNKSAMIRAAGFGYNDKGRLGIGSGRRYNLCIVVQEFRSEVGAIRPSDGPSIDGSQGEIVRVFKELEHFPL